MVTHLDETERVPTEQTSVIGFCFGGRAAFTAATLLHGLASTVSFYGPGIASGPHAVLGQAAQITGPVMILVGDQDPTIPAADLQAVRAACAEAGVDVRLKVFAGAGHAFHCDARPAAYQQDAAGEAWRDALSFLAETLPGASPSAG
jgi:carboxymethylenebutenolidase